MNDFVDAKTKALKEIAVQIGATSLDEVWQFLNGSKTVSAIQGGIGKGLNAATFGTMPKTVGRFAGSGPVRTLARFVPGLAVGTAALGAADIVAGDDSLGNKAMDSVAMLGGGALGAVLGGGPLGAAAGASIGKMGSDSLQWLFGDKKTADQRRLEEAMLLLGGRN